MAFHFPLQAVFHFRQSVEHQQELRLRTANQQVARARRERETFESLRDHQLQDYQRAAARREQRQLDDLFLLRQAYLKRG